MDTRISPLLRDDPAAQEARALLSRCVHCGFCTATCPTYQILGDERDGPRGRLYLIHQLLETGTTSSGTRQHLERCLLCRSCETTCPSGVNYHRLLHIGRHLSGVLQAPPLSQRLRNVLLRSLLPYPKRLGPALGAARLVRPLLPAGIREKIPRRQTDAGRKLCSSHARKVLLFQGCVQSAVARDINDATCRVLDHLGVECLTVAGERCCGAVHHHLDAENQARKFARHNIDQWLPLLREGAEALLVTASACALEIQEYPQLFDNDPAYQQKARELLQYCQEIGSFLSRQNTGRLKPTGIRAMALHLPCTQQHGLGNGDKVIELLSRLGFEVRLPADNHLCCGSAGTYSLQQPRLANRLRQDKLQALEQTGAEIIASANIGCLLHLGEQSRLPVKHWIQWLDACLRD